MGCLEIIEVGADRLGEYDQIPSRFSVTTCLEIELIHGGLGGMLLHERAVDVPYIKDYDSYGEIPSDWPKKFDLQRWGFLFASIGGHVVGAAALAYDTGGVFTLEDAV